MTEKQPILSKAELKLIRAAMKRRGINQTRLAEMIGVGKQIISHWFHAAEDAKNGRAPSVKSRLLIAYFLGLCIQVPTPARIIRKTKKASKR